MGVFKQKQILETEMAERAEPGPVRFYFDTDLGVPHADSGRWRSYHLIAQGDTLKALVADAAIFEIDQDGGEIGSYGLDGASGEVENAAMAILEYGTGKVFCSHCDQETPLKEIQSGYCDPCAEMAWEAQCNRHCDYVDDNRDEHDPSL